MDDLTLAVELDDTSTLYVTPLARETVEQHSDGADLGGSNGYFVVRSVRTKSGDRLEILAKAASFSAASALFDLIVARQARSTASPTEPHWA